MTGTRLARIVFEWLLANLEIGELQQSATGAGVGQTAEPLSRKTLVLGPKAIYAAEAFSVGLFQVYPTVYLHKTTRGAEKLAQFVLERVAKLVTEGDTSKLGLPATHPLISFFKNPGSSQALCSLDDAVVYSAFSLLRDSDDRLIADFSGRLLDRRLFKSIDLLAMAGLNLRIKKAEDHEKAVAQLRFGVQNKIDDWITDNPDREGHILFDFAKREIYKPMGEEPSMNDIWIREGGRLVPLRERSEAVRAIGTFFAIRAYVDERDEEARRFVEECVSTAAKGEAS